MTKGICRDCGIHLPPHNIGTRCPRCQEKGLAKTSGTSPLHYNTKDIMEMLGLTSQEQVRRHSRDRKIPGRVPLVQEHLCYQETVDEWIRQHQIIPKQYPTILKQRQAVSVSYYDQRNYTDSYPQISTVAGWYVRPLHYGALLRKSSTAVPRQIQRQPTLYQCLIYSYPSVKLTVEYLL